MCPAPPFRLPTPSSCTFTEYSCTIPTLKAVMKKRKTTGKIGRKKEILLIDDSFAIHRKKGNGIIRRQVWVDEYEEVTRYSLAYINYNLFQGDNGRVLGYDNAHAQHHKHYMGHIEQIAFTSFKKLENQFQREFEALHEKIKKK